MAANDEAFTRLTGTDPVLSTSGRPARSSPA